MQKLFIIGLAPMLSLAAPTLKELKHLVRKVDRLVHIKSDTPSMSSAASKANPLDHETITLRNGNTYTIVCFGAVSPSRLDGKPAKFLGDLTMQQVIQSSVLTFRNPFAGKGLMGAPDICYVVKTGTGTPRPKKRVHKSVTTSTTRRYAPYRRSY